jgi:hypothetical protein
MGVKEQMAVTVSEKNEQRTERTERMEPLRPELVELLQATGLVVRMRKHVLGGEVLELRASHGAEMQTVLFDAIDEQELELAMRLELGEAEPLSVSLSGERALTLQGVLSSGLHSQGINAQLVGDDHGVRAVMLSVRMPGEVTVERFTRRLDQLRALSSELGPALKGKPEQMLGAVKSLVRVRNGGLGSALPNGVKVGVAPAFERPGRESVPIAVKMPHR